MQEYQQRVVTEKHELDDRLLKLTNFVGGSIFPELDFMQQTLLLTQLRVMQAYSGVLDLRIKSFAE